MKNWNKLNKNKREKKWRFWRIFKKVFKRTKIQNFKRIKQHFIKNYILWSQMKILYGRKIKKLIYAKTHWKIAYNNSFCNCLVFLELRLNILSLRIKFVSKLLIANFLIKNMFILINNKPTKKNYIVRIGDNINLLLIVLTYRKRIKKLKRRLLKAIHKFRTKRLKKRLNWYNPLFWRSRKTLILNYMVINYKILAAILIRKPLLGEILIKNNKKLLSLQLLKKIYFLY